MSITNASCVAISGGVFAIGVPLVPAKQIGRYFFERHVHAAPLHFLPAAPGPRLHRGGHEQLHIGIGGDHGPDIAPVQHRAARLHGKGALAFEQGLADRGMDGDPARPPARFLVAQGRIQQQAIGENRHL